MDAAKPADAAPLAKKFRLTLKKQLEIAQAEKAALEVTLRDTTSALQESIGREQQMVAHLQSRFGREVGEHPVEYAKRVAANIAHAAKVASEERQEFLRKQAGYRAEIQMLNGQLNTLEGSLEGLVQVAKAGKKQPPPPSQDMQAPGTSTLLERAIDRVMARPNYPFGLGGL